MNKNIINFLVIPCLIVMIFNGIVLESKAQTIDFNKTRVFLDSFMVHSRVDPPDSLDDGKWIGFYENGKIAFSGTYESNKPTGQFLIYDDVYDSLVTEKYEMVNGFAVYYEKWNIDKLNSNPFKSYAVWINKDSTQIKKNQIPFSTVTTKKFDSNGKLIAFGVRSIETWLLTCHMPFFRFYEGNYLLSIPDETYIYNSNGNMEYTIKRNRRWKEKCFSPDGKKIKCP